MSWSRTIGRFPCAVLGAVLLIAGLALGGCGFHPVYGKGNEHVVPQLANVKVGNIEDRNGQMLRNLLFTKLNPRGQPAQPRYLLETELKEITQALAIQIDEVATRANLYMDANYKLIDLRTGYIVFEQGTRAASSYDIVQNEFANLSAQKDARERALRQVSEEITTQLSFFFERRDPDAQPAQVQAVPPAQYQPAPPAQYQTAPQ